MKIFKNTGFTQQSAHFGWQNKDEALYGIREGYKYSADELVEIVVNSGNNIKKLDTYIFPIMFSYRHAVEISLKHIYLRAYGNIPSGGHSLLELWDKVRKEIIDDMINSEKFLKQVKEYKNNFIKYSLDGISIDKIRFLIKELQEANQIGDEVNSQNRQVDQNAEVWRYLISTDEQLYFKFSHSIDYLVLKESMNYIYEVLDYIYYIVDEYLSN